MKTRLLSLCCALLFLGAALFVPPCAHAAEAAPAAPAGLAAFLSEAQDAGFSYVFSGSDQIFDGSRTVQGSPQEIARLRQSVQGTILVRYRALGGGNQVLFAAGSTASAESYGAILANAVSGVNQQRVEFPDGMKANLAGTQATGGWHTFVYSVNASDPADKTAKTVTSFDGSTSTQYPDYASWFNQNAAINDIQYLTIGGVPEGFTGSGNAGGFVGRIALAAFVPRALSQAEAAALSAEPWAPTEGQLLYSAENISIASPQAAPALSPGLVGQLGALDELSVIVKFKNTHSGVGSLLSVSDPGSGNSHFHLYQNGNLLGFEYRDRDAPFYAASCTVYPREWNTVAFSASRQAGYKLFANGAPGAVLEKTGSDYRFLSDIITWTQGFLGKTSRSNDPDSYPFTGLIESIQVYSGALSDEELLLRTAGTRRTGDFVFFAGDATGSQHFRIPFLWNTPQGDLIAGVDANFGSGGDSAENIDIAVRVKPAAAQHAAMEGWLEPSVPAAMHMQDYADENGYKQGSASFIDAVILQDTLNTGRVFLLADAWAWNGGLFEHLADESGGTKMRTVARGDGFCTIGGKKYLLLSSQNLKGSANGQTGNINNNTDRSRFNYAADVYGQPNASGLYPVYHLNGTPRAYSSLANRPVDDGNLSLGALSEYGVSQDYELYKNGQPLTVRQRSADPAHPAVSVPMKLFYEDSELQLYNTSYIMQFYSDDAGRTWHTDKLISGMVKRENSQHYILGPGRGLQLQQGQYAGRLIVPVYYQSSPKAEVIYSDDNGRTWAHGESVSSIYGLSEAAPVEMPDGSLKLFLRNTSILGGTVVEATSTDGGQSWRDVKCTFSNNSAGINCQLSAIRLSGTVRSQKDGQEYPAMLLSSANLKDRTHGRIFVGLLKENGAYPGGAKKYTVDWEYQYDVTPQGILFAYSCLAELSDGRVALLYESSPNSSWDDGLRMTYYREFDRQTLLG